ncbi:hypothetical protein Ppa06_67480 [Planomonospora parontospora subsp. parontospora]|uniref:TniQ domain-containing protein n=3 Tax=Planomonospora parontospora TaxID=58119 RepID=A0AA37BP40_9ACTN|nr:hypothetical protein GCM10010126_68680 [Planomonospora parontospora]GII12950.1 hypothetical protein Ppa06_67480 [Planomonospora parontospora subsp. parontospora]
MLPQERAEEILTLHAAGWSTRAIAASLGHSQNTIRGYLNGDRTPGVRAPRPSLLTDLLANYCRQRFFEDPILRPSALFREVTQLGFEGSRATFYRELAQRRLPPPDHRPADPNKDSPQALADDGIAKTPRPFVPALQRAPVLPRRVAPLAGEPLISYLTRLAHANHLTVSEVLAVLPTWFSTKVNNRNDRAQHHALVPETADALLALAHLTAITTTSLARALPAFRHNDEASPLRATTACRRCTARRGINERIAVHLPAHQKICTRHRIWLSDPGQPHLDLAACPEITIAQLRANRLLHRHKPQQLMLAYQAAIREVPPWPRSPASLPAHWRYRLLILQSTNHGKGTPDDHDAYIDAAKYPDAIALTAAMLTPKTGRNP